MPEATNVAANPTNAANSPSGSPPSEAPGSQGATLEKTGFTWGTEAPPELQGKTPKQTLDQYNQLVTATRQFVAQTQQQAAAQQQAVAVAAQQRQAAQMAADNKTIGDMLYSEPEKALNQFGANLGARIQTQMGQQVGAAIAPLYQGLAQTARSQAQAAEPDLWAKYGAEIEAITANVPVAAQTNPELWKQAARIVKANHLDEIVQERAATIATAGGFGVESGGGGGGAPGTSPGSNKALDKMKESAYGTAMIARYGERKWMDMVRKMADNDGISVESYAEKVAKSKAAINPVNPTQVVNRGLGIREVANG